MVPGACYVSPIFQTQQAYPREEVCLKIFNSLHFCSVTIWQVDVKEAVVEGFEMATV